MPRILVVEDNAINRELLCDWLEAQDYVALSTEDLGDAQRLLKDEQPDAVLLDVQLGNEDGLSLAAWMRRQPGGHPHHRGDRPRPGDRTTTVLAVRPQRLHIKPIDFKLLDRELGKWLLPLEKSPSRV